MNIKKWLPQEPLIQTKGHTISDFWAWAYSDVLNNLNRAIFAEYIVALALNITDTPRKEWDSVDLHYQGKGIEIKSSAYIQSWEQKNLSRISYDIAPKKSLIANTNIYNGTPSRWSDCYVFCLYDEKEKSNKDNILDLSEWSFIVIATETINQKFSDQKSIVLNKLENIQAPIMYSDLKNEIDNTLGV